MSSSLQITAQGYLYLDKDKQFADDLYDLEKEHTAYRAQKIRDWAKNTEELIKLKLYPGPKESISTYLRHTMKLRGWNKYQLAYISESLPREFKNENKDRSDLFGQPNKIVTDEYLDALEEEDSVYSQYTEIAKRVNFKSQFAKYSPAEQREIILEGEKQDKEERKRISERQKMRREFAKENNLYIEDFEKESAELPPEKFWGSNEFSEMLKTYATKLHRLADRVDRTVLLFEQFKPTAEVAHEAAGRLQDFLVGKFDVFDVYFNQFIDLCDNIFVHYDDAKYRQHLPGWMKIAHDQLANAGSHGSGMINSVSAGIYPIFISEDGKTVHITGIKRPFTREIVGDETGKLMGPQPQEVLIKLQTKLQRKALNIILENDLAQALMIASDKTKIEEEGIDPEVYHEQELQRRRRQG